MTKDDQIWAEHYQTNLEICAELDRTAAEAVFEALPDASFVKGADRAIRVRLLTSTIAAFEGEYGWPQTYGWPMAKDGSFCPMFLEFAVKNLPRSGGTAGAALRQQIFMAAIKDEEVCDPWMIYAALDSGIEVQELIKLGIVLHDDA